MIVATLSLSLSLSLFSFYANIFFNTTQDFTKWYFELHYTPTSSSKGTPPHHLRVGTANYIAFQPYPGDIYINYLIYVQTILTSSIV